MPPPRRDPPPASAPRRGSLSAEQVAAYRRDGILFPIPVLSPGEVAAFRAALREVAEALGEEAKRRIGLPHLHFRCGYDLAIHPAVLDAVESVLGPDLLIKGSVVLGKPPGDPAFVAWHQDGTYSRLHESDNVSAWIALSDSVAENGCMRVVPGSHLLGLQPHVESTAEHHLLARKPEVAVEVDESRALDVALRPGEMSLHHSNVIHGSRPNRSGRERVGFIVRFATPEMDSSQVPVVRARGSADSRHLEILGEPPPRDLAAAMAAREEFFRHSRAR
jgi:ectoine hydroxylase-related dioxygenase (phytanoyl-CoA dioxygenase family)